MWHRSEFASASVSKPLTQDPLYLRGYQAALEQAADLLERDASTYYDQFMSYELASSDAAVALRASAKAIRNLRPEPQS